MDKLFDLFTFDGRANRAWYFWHIVLDDLAIITAMLALVVLGATMDISGLVILPALGVMLGGGMAAIAITVRRLHDLERPGWHWWLLMIPLYNLYLGLVLLFKPGTVGPNQYGHDPLEAARRSAHLSS
jgi:uncharacterized membrane protein YhaH (DUF805 family)